MFCLLVACGGSGGGNPAKPSAPGAQAPTPAPTTFSLSGKVTETAPTSSTPIAGARVSIGDGPNAGRSTTTDAAGTYTFASLERSGFTVTASADGYEPRSQGVDLTANRTVNFQLRPLGPRTTFGSGQHLVGRDIAAGRYFADPASGCYWERQSGLGGTLGEIVANDFVAFNSAQSIVDILASDLAFETDSECGTWYNSPRHAHRTDIAPGTWLVGAQVSPGTYRVTAQAGCYWERLRDFTGTLNGIISNDFVSSGGVQYVTVYPGDTGFATDGDCGTWAPASSSAGGGEVEAAVRGTLAGSHSRRDIEANRQMNRRQHPGRLR
ncbi:MAG: carboxypeptidase regulatory-like domain-containing protein [Vicinamibacteraceae bacterium]|nr:carboxypeptidase regulatory-like domain-containing protein [Vicinamibacteraceae bacterium]